MPDERGPGAEAIRQDAARQPAGDARAPERPSIAAAAIFVTPRSMAWATMWKIGPECAAQHPKWTSATPQNAGWRSTAGRRQVPAGRRRRARPAGRISAPYPRRPRSSGRFTRYRRATLADDPGEAAERGESRPPSERRDERAGGGRDDEDPQAHAARDDAHGQAAPRGEPARGGRRQRDVERARPERPHDAERDVELTGRADLAGRDQRGAEEPGADRDDAPRSDPIGDGARDERADPEDDPVDEGDPGDQGPGPAELLLERPEEHGQREDRAGADGDDGHRGQQDDPPVEHGGPGRAARRCAHGFGLYPRGRLAWQ